MPFVGAIPRDSRSRGVPGQRAVDRANKLIYHCVLPDYWVRQPYVEFGQVELNYVSDGDANGVFNFMGTNFGIEAWSNPLTRGLVAVTPVPDAHYNTGSDLPALYFDRVSNHADLNGTAPLKTVIDLGFGRSLIMTEFSYRYRQDGGAFAPTGWTVDGSNDNTTWTNVLTVTGQTVVAGGWVSSAVTSNIAYRFWRITQTSSAQPTFFTIGELEFYGRFFI